MSVAIRNGIMTITCDVCGAPIKTKKVGTQITITGNTMQPVICVSCMAEATGNAVWKIQLKNFGI